MCTFAINENLNGIEITFESKPSSEIRDSLKVLGFRWHGQKKLWYAKKTDERMALATQLSGNSEAAEMASAQNPIPAARVQKNKYGVKVGDVFMDMWGYDQTNVDYYQVVALRGTTQVILKPVKKSARSVGWCSEMVKPIKNAFFPLEAYKTRQCGSGVESIIRTVKSCGNGYIIAGSGRESMSLTSWDSETNETSYA